MLVWLILAPVLAVIVGLFCGGVVLGASEGLHLTYFAGLLADGEFQAALVFTIAIACSVTAISCAGGFALALALRSTIQRRAGPFTLLQFPLALPHIAMAFLALSLLSASGLIARVGHVIGLVGQPADFPSLMNDRYGVGILIVYAAKEIPFVAVVVLAALLRTGEEHHDAARTLGASKWQRLRHVTLPMSATALLSASVLVFAYVFSAFEVPFIAGRAYPAMLPVLMQQRYFASDLSERPAAAAIGLVISLLTCLFVWLYLRLARRVTGSDRPVLFF